MSEAAALFVREGDTYVGTSYSQGGWDPTVANGGAVLALAGQVLDAVPTLAPMAVSRFTADLVRAVPLGRPLHVHTEVVREGKKIQVVELRVQIDGVDLVRASALRLRLADFTGEGDLPPSTTDERPGNLLVPPLEAPSYREITPGEPGFLKAVEMRRAPYRDGSALGCWLKLLVPVVAGEEVTPTARQVFPIDFVNLIGLRASTVSYTMINADVSAHMLRPPVGDWIAITGQTRFSPAIGRGVSIAQLSDDDGLFGTSSTSQLLQPR